MSSSFLCLDCKRSITFLNVGDPKSVIFVSGGMMMHLCMSTIAYVRCNACGITEGRLPADKAIAYEDTLVDSDVIQSLYINVASFLKTEVWKIALVTNTPSEGSSSYPVANVDQAVVEEIRGLVSVTLDGGRPGPVYPDFLPDSEDRIITDEDLVPNTSTYMERIAHQVRDASIKYPNVKADLHCFYCVQNVGAYWMDDIHYMEMLKDLGSDHNPESRFDINTILLFVCPKHIPKHANEIKQIGSSTLTHKKNASELIDYIKAGPHPRPVEIVAAYEISIEWPHKIVEL